MAGVASGQLSVIVIPVMLTGWTGRSCEPVGALAIAITLGSPWVGALAWAVAGCVGFGRLFYGKHWPTDVLAGFVLAITAGLLVHRHVTPRVLAAWRRRRGPPVAPPDGGSVPR